MATARETIALAARKLRITGRSANVSAAESTDALADLNAFLLHLWDVKLAFPATQVRVDSAYTLSNETRSAQFLCVSTSALTITLPQTPADGQRIQPIDVNGVAATAPITLSRNLMKINGQSADYVISTPSANPRLMFRPDLGDWVVAVAIAIEDDLPWPTEYHYGLGLCLARYMSEYGQALSKNDDEMADETLRLMRARYLKPPLQRPDSGMSRMGGAGMYPNGFLGFWDGTTNQ